MRAPETFVELPLPARLAVVGGLVLGVLGAVIGLVVGWTVYRPTAWAAALEIGVPSALLGALLGLAAGSVWLAVSRRRAS